MDTTSSRFGSGRSVRRIEDDKLLQGLGQFTDDITGDSTYAEHVHACFLRSPYPHARIVSVDTAAALAMPGVVAVYQGADLVAAGVKPIPGSSGFPRTGGAPGATPPRHILAHERARHVGEAVAVVLASTMEQARDAAEAVVVDYDELPMVVTLAGAITAGAPVVCDDAPDNIAAEMRHGNAAATDQAFAGATHVVKLDLTNQRLAALTLEPRSVLALVDPKDGRLLVRMSSQMPSGIRNSLGKDIMGIGVENIRVTVGDVGGGFGMKGGIHPEDAVIAWCAWTLKRPVKWIADRSEEFLSSATGRDTESHAELALDASGRILGLRVHAFANVGAYATGAGVAIPLLIGPWVQTGVYDIQTIDFHFRAVLTNTAPVGAYRGAGRPEAIYIIERLMDEAARQSGIDRISLRRRNFIRPDQMPYKNPMAQVYDDGKFEHVMDQALAMADWDGFAARAAASRSSGKWRGLGIATFLEWTGANVFEERVTLTVLADGVIEVFAAVNGMGQGIATSLAQLVVDVFDVPLENIRVVLGDTDRGDGFGSAGSRSIFAGGSAVRVGSERTIDHARLLAASKLEAHAQDIEYSAGRFQVKGTDLGIGLFELAAAQDGKRIHLESTSSVSGPSWPNGCHVCEIELTPQTGEVQVLRYTSMNDVGRVVNPMIVVGQLDGGAIQGIGQALTEAVVYDPQSGQLLTGSLMDYAAPRADITPAFRNEMDQSTPCKNNPLGVKGVGELGTIGATPCIVNAVADALARNGKSGRTPLLQMPLTPARLWEQLQA
ncbi:MAG TPA: xanthine dehydrogenase family protein molybdopterin-binding subunit [Burkholderiaceae bacterium]|nr:xanthine dehydrogenase family protein molybdopterin-binding subunit [Burkholderiaceae bacterium]